jgi:dTMP kinase
VPEAVSQQLVAEKQKRTYIQGAATHDIHERDADHLKDARTAARYVADKYGWKPVQSYVDGAMRSVEDIHADVVRILAGN